MANALTCVDLSPTPEQVYMILESLYETEGLFKPEDTMDTINYLEARLLDADLPLNLEAYQEEIKSPENNTWKQLNIYELQKEN